MNRTSAISAGIAAAFAVALFCMLPAHPAAARSCAVRPAPSSEPAAGHSAADCPVASLLQLSAGHSDASSGSAAGQQVWITSDSLRTVPTLPGSDAPAADGSTSAPSADGTDGSTPAPSADTDVCTVKLDSTLLGHSIFDILSSLSCGDSGTVVVHQSPDIAAAFEEHIASNEFREEDGYRIRVFFSNAQNSRGTSLRAADIVSEKYPGLPVYRTFVQPNFKVTVGDFRRKSEALQLLEMLRRDFPSAFIVREPVILYNR